jgi:voltage-gated sodium channel
MCLPPRRRDAFREPGRGPPGPGSGREIHAAHVCRVTSHIRFLVKPLKDTPNPTPTPDGDLTSPHPHPQKIQNTEMENVDYENRYDETMVELEFKVQELSGKTELAKQQLSKLKLNKSKSMYDAKHGLGDFADLGKASASAGVSAEIAMEAYERDEKHGNLLAKGHTSEKANEPLPWKKLYKAALKVGMRQSQAVALTVVHNNFFNVTINLTIVVASLAVGLETDNPQWHDWLGPINQLCLLIFTVELVSKLVGLKRFFWTDPEAATWNKFDFVIVGLSLLDWAVELGGAGLRSGGIVMVLRVLRLLRVLRSLRTLQTSSSLMVLMESIGEAIAPTSSVFIILLIIFYIFAILFTELVGKASHFEGDEYIHTHFGTVANSFGMLLQILTLDSWTQTCRYVQLHSESTAYILLVWAMYVAFILLAPLMMLNCLNAIFVEGVITKITHKKLEKVKQDLNTKQDIAKRLAQIFQDLDKSGDGFVTVVELDEAIETTDVIPQIRTLGLKRHHLEAMFVTADDNGDGQIDCIEFLRGFSDLLNIPLNRKDIVKMAAEQSSALTEGTYWAFPKSQYCLPYTTDTFFHLSQTRGGTRRRKRITWI